MDSVSADLTSEIDSVILHVSSKEASDHARDNEDGDKNPNPFDNLFGIFVVEKTHNWLTI